MSKHKKTSKITNQRIQDTNNKRRQNGHISVLKGIQKQLASGDTEMNRKEINMRNSFGVWI